MSNLLVHHIAVYSTGCSIMGTVHIPDPASSFAVSDGVATNTHIINVPISAGGTACRIVFQNERGIPLMECSIDTVRLRSSDKLSFKPGSIRLMFDDGESPPPDYLRVNNEIGARYGNLVATE
jgi:hypothetical protein